VLDGHDLEYVHGQLRLQLVERLDLHGNAHAVHADPRDQVHANDRLLRLLDAVTGACRRRSRAAERASHRPLR
jgi:hypothetical protein